MTAIISHNPGLYETKKQEYVNKSSNEVKLIKCVQKFFEKIEDNNYIYGATDPRSYGFTYDDFLEGKGISEVYLEKFSHHIDNLPKKEKKNILSMIKDNMLGLNCSFLSYALVNMIKESGIRNCRIEEIKFERCQVNCSNHRFDGVNMADHIFHEHHFISVSLEEGSKLYIDPTFKSCNNLLEFTVENLGGPVQIQTHRT